MKSLHVLCVLLISATTLWAESPTAKDLEAIEIDGIRLGMPFKEVLKMPEFKDCKQLDDMSGCKIYQFACRKSPTQNITRNFLSYKLTIAVKKLRGEERVVGFSSLIKTDGMDVLMQGSRYNKALAIIEKRAGESPNTNDINDDSGARRLWDTGLTGIVIQEVPKELWTPQLNRPGMPRYQPAKLSGYAQYFVIRYDEIEGVFNVTGK